MDDKNARAIAGDGGGPASAAGMSTEYAATHMAKALGDGLASLEAAIRSGTKLTAEQAAAVQAIRDAADRFGREFSEFILP